MRSAISAWKSQSRHFTSTSKWGKLSLGAVKSCPQPWEKLKIGVIGAPLNLGQVCCQPFFICSTFQKFEFPCFKKISEFVFTRISKISSKIGKMKQVSKIEG